MTTIYNPTIFIIESDDDTRHSMITALSACNYPIKDYSNPIKFLKNVKQHDGCIISNTEMSQMHGIDMQDELNKLNIDIPLIFVTACGDIKMSVKAIKRGAYDFIERPLDSELLKKTVKQAIAHDYENHENKIFKQQILMRYETLTRREKEVLLLLCENNGTLTNQIISENLRISKRTVEVHRSAIMGKMLAHTRAELIAFCHYADDDIHRYQPATINNAQEKKFANSHHRALFNSIK